MSNLTASQKDALDSLFALSDEQITTLAGIVCPDVPMEGYSGRPLAHILDATLVDGVDGEQAIRNLLALLG